MSVFVDQLMSSRQYYESTNKRWNWNQSCHLTADTETELHDFAARLGLRRAWFQNHHRLPVMWHYDLNANKRRQAVSMGAIELTAQQWVEKVREALEEEKAGKQA